RIKCRNADWETERARLQALLTPDETESARATTLNAHYTAPPIIRAIYALLQQLLTSRRIKQPRRLTIQSVSGTPSTTLQRTSDPVRKSKGGDAGECFRLIGSNRQYSLFLNAITGAQPRGRALLPPRFGWFWLSNVVKLFRLFRASAPHPTCFPETLMEIVG